MRVLVIDNYDSFTFNLVQYLGELGAELQVFRNDRITLEQIEQLAPDKIVLSPGPGRPDEAGICISCISRFAPRIPMLGVCLGHQAMGAAFGGKIGRAATLMHGKTSEVQHDGKTIFKDLPCPMTATRYHSLMVCREGFPSCLEISAETDDGIIMGLRHREHPMEGVQFHPESILTLEGKRLLTNFLLSPLAQKRTDFIS
jgi:anthranilate synthase/aminodeoxychorismate synthase-like glutamine amidotransferase